MIEKELDLWLGERRGTEVVYVSQYDTLWQFKIRIIYNSQVWEIPSGASVFLNGRKPDGNVFSFPCSVANNVITVDADVQMTCVAGKTICEVSVISGNNVAGSANFILLVEPSPNGPDDVISQSALDAFGQIIAQINPSSANGVSF